MASTVYHGPEDAALPAHVKKMSRVDRAKWVNVYNSAVRVRNAPHDRARKAADAVLQPAKTHENKLITVCAKHQPVFMSLGVESVKGEKIHRFKKAIVPALHMKHPLTGQEIPLSEDMLKLSCLETNRFLKDGNQCAFPDEHGGMSSARANLGWWEPEFATERVKDANGVETLWSVGIVDVPLEADAEKIVKGTIKYVSPGILGEWTDAHGRTYNALMYHVAATNRPVTPGQSGFERVELSIGGSPKRVFSVLHYEQVEKKGEHMFAKKAAVLLGLDENASEDQIESALKKMLTPGSGDMNLSIDTNPKFLALSASVETLKAQNAALQANAENAKKSHKADYLLSIQTKATNEFGVPLTKDQMDTVEKLLDANMSDEAKKLGVAYLSVCEATRTKKPENTRSTGAPEKQQEEISEKERVASVAKTMTAAGFEVTLSADGTKIEKAEPRTVGNKQK